jgi:cytochrome P450
MSFRTTLKTIVDNIMLMFVFPIPVMKLFPSARMKQTYSAYAEFEKVLHELLDSERRGETKYKNDSILRALVEHEKAEKDGHSDGGLDDSEIIGNAFVLLLGGYESTYVHALRSNFRAKVMMYAVMELALRPELQEQLFREISNVCGDRLPAIQDISKLILPLCVMYETMRLHPVASCLSHLTRGNDELLLNQYPVTPSTRVGLDYTNLGRNERIWGQDVLEFRPSRFDCRFETDGFSVDGRIRMPVRGAFNGFSDGPRACLGISCLYIIDSVGRRFAEAEFVTYLVMLVQKWTFHLKEGWTEGRMREAIESKASILTLMPSYAMPVTLRRREI